MSRSFGVIFKLFMCSWGLLLLLLLLGNSDFGFGNFLYSRIIFGLGYWYIFVVGFAGVGLNFNLGFVVIGWAAGSCLFRPCLDVCLSKVKVADLYLV